MRKPVKTKTLMTTKQYAEIRGITQNAVRQAFNMGHKLPGVEEVQKSSRFYLFLVNDKALVDYMLKNLV